eukprot:14467934-Heterocapsa_arctica.AAC.1
MKNDAEGVAVSEQVKLKLVRTTELTDEKQKPTALKKKECAETLKYHKEYTTHQRTLIPLCRQAKIAGNLFMGPEAKHFF